MSTHRDIIRRVGIAVIAVAALVLLSACGGDGVQGARSGGPTSGASTAQLEQAPALPGAQPISPSDRVYTADQTSNTVSVINPATNEVLGTIALGAQRLGDILGPQYLRDVDVHGLGFSRDGQYLDAVSVTSNTVTVIRTADNSIVSQTTVGRSSHEGFFSPDGQTVWVADRALSQLDIVDALHGGVVGHVTTEPGPSKVLF
ncbi:YncE family protein, partial [Rhodococcus jostii]|uniref:YncE family protein n=2 Tax=Rhodococcus jostii TaxID=132919 RepID=UPI003654D250